MEQIEKTTKSFKIFDIFSKFRRLQEDQNLQTIITIKAENSWNISLNTKDTLNDSSLQLHSMESIFHSTWLHSSISFVSPFLRTKWWSSNSLSASTQCIFKIYQQLHFKTSDYLSNRTLFSYHSSITSLRSQRLLKVKIKESLLDIYSIWFTESLAEDNDA